MPLADIEKYYSDCPEPRFELVDGRFYAGNDLRGNRYVMSALLEGWGLEAAIPFAPADVWLQALRAAFETHDPPSPATSLDAWIAWAREIEYQPTVEPAGPRDDRLHRGICNRLRFALFATASDTGIGQSYSRVVMRLGEDAWMPDLFFVASPHLDRLSEYFLDGPADIVIEVVLPGHENRDRVERRQRYAAGGVAEYWIVDPRQRVIEFLRFDGGEYRRQATGSDGRYRPPSVPGLAIVTNHLWEGMDELGWHVPKDAPPLFEVDAETVVISDKSPRDGESDPGWGSLPFSPRIRLEPATMSFEQYISWCPEPKFEVVDRKPVIDGTAGTHDLCGFLIQSLGLVDVVRLRHPNDWVEALIRREAGIAADASKRESWWKQVRAAGQMLRDDFGFESVSVIGDLVHDRPLSIWSSVTLVVDRVPYGVHLFEAYRAIYDDCQDTCIHDLREPARLNPSQRAEFESAAVQV